MSGITFQKATKRQIKARIALDGPSGAGKTWSGLTIARELGERVCWIDSERRSASLYADHFDFDTFVFEKPYDPARLVDVLRAADAEGYDVIGIDSLSHFWEGEGGTLDIVDGAGRQQFGGNKYAGWSVGTPVLRRLVDTMLDVNAHLIVSMRSKMDYLEVEGPNGKKSYEKVGMAPVMRAGIEYEFTLVGDLDLQHRLFVSKSRCDVVADKTYSPGSAGDLGKEFKAWLEDGEPVLTAEQLAEIRAIVMAVPDDENRRLVGTALGERFGPAPHILQSRFDAVLAYAKELAGTSAPTAPLPTEPPHAPDALEVAQTNLEFAYQGMLDSQRETCRAEIKRTFGEPEQMKLDEFGAALKIIEDWPKPADKPEEKADVPKAPRRSAKLRSFIALARGEGMGERELVALMSFMNNSLEPRPLEELDEAGITSLQSLVEDVKAKKLAITEGNNGVLIVKEAQPA